VTAPAPLTASASAASQPTRRQAPGPRPRRGHRGHRGTGRRLASRSSLALLILGGALLVSVIAAVGIGQAQVSPRAVLAVVAQQLGLPLPAGAEPTAMQTTVIWHLRLPRVLAAAVVGAGLALVGAVLQTVTRNPLADPFLLGLSSGASLGAVAVVVLGAGAGALALPLGAFAGALAAFALVLLLGAQGRRLSPLRVVLAGVAVAQLAAALTSLVIIWAGMPQATQVMQFWLAGSLGRARWATLAPAVVVLVVVGAVALRHARALDAFAFGEDAASSLGVEVARLRWVLLLATAALTGTLVAISGTIGFVGLVLPHAARFLVGPRHRLLLPVSALAGAVLLAWIDTLARTAFAPRELPVGLVTALVGVPAFLFLLRRVRVLG
jgi:iron complex transport system permease protein